MKRLVEEDTVIKVYEGSQEDSMALLRWYNELLATGDLEKVLFPGTHILGEFMAYFHSGKVRLVYIPDDAGAMKLVTWGEGLANGLIMFSLWMRPVFAHSRAGVQAAYDLYREIFEIFTVIQGITKQERLLKLHKKWGYEVVAKIPGIWAGVEDGWLVQLTKDNFYAACGREGE